MPTYDYKCQACGFIKEVVHPMSECDTPSEKLIEEITCPFGAECQVNWQNHLGMEIPRDHELVFKRTINEPTIQGSYGGSSLSGKEKLNKIQGERKERSHKDFKKNVFPTLPKQEQKWFKNKKNGREY